MFKASAKVSSPTVSSAHRLRTESLKSNASVASSVSLKKRGCRSVILQILKWGLWDRPQHLKTFPRKIRRMLCFQSVELGRETAPKVVT